MPLAALFACDLAAVVALVALYVRRHRRRDMVLALLGINVGVLAVTQALSSAQISAGLGLGLFGVLSIIRLRSEEMNQSEVSYYFAALALGLLGGFAVSPSWLSPVLMAAIVVTVFVGDHERVMAGYRHQIVTLDRAYPTEELATERLEELLGAKVRRLTIRKLDLVNDTTVVDVRYQIDSTSPAPQHHRAAFEVHP